MRAGLDCFTEPELDKFLCLVRNPLAPWDAAAESSLMVLLR